MKIINQQRRLIFRNSFYDICDIHLDLLHDFYTTQIIITKKVINKSIIYKIKRSRNVDEGDFDGNQEEEEGPNANDVE